MIGPQAKDCGEAGRIVISVPYLVPTLRGATASPRKSDARRVKRGAALVLTIPHK